MINTSLFCDRVKKERERLGLSQGATAELCGVSREVWGKYERGQVVPSALVVEKYVSHGADALYLFTGERTSKNTGGISQKVMLAIIEQLQQWQILHKKTLPPEAAKKVVLALLDLVDGDENKVEVVAKTILKLVA